MLLVVITTFAYSMLAERKVMGWMQLRPGPNRVGPWGLLQPAADAVKMIFKEDLTPDTADPLIYRLAPFISLICAMGTFAIIPFSASADGTLWSVGNVNAGILFIFAIDVDRRVRDLAGGLGVGLEVSAARLGALDRADDLLRALDDDVGDRRADPGRLDRAGRHRQRAAAAVVHHPADRRLPDLRHHRGRRDQPRAVRPGRSGDRARRRLPHRVLRAALRAVLHRRVPQHDHGVVPGDAALPGRLELADSGLPSGGSSGWFGS